MDRVWDEIRELLDLYYIGDQRVTQVARTYERAEIRLAAMKEQRAELDLAISDLEAEMEKSRHYLAQHGAREAAE